MSGYKFNVGDRVTYIGPCAGRAGEKICIHVDNVKKIELFGKEK